MLKKSVSLLILAALVACSQSESVPTPAPAAASKVSAVPVMEDAMPRYPGAKIIFSMGTEDGITLGLETNDPREKVIAFYQDFFKGKPRVTIQESKRGIFFAQQSEITSGPSGTVLVKPDVNGVTTVALYSRR